MMKKALLCALMLLLLPIEALPVAGLWTDDSAVSRNRAQKPRKRRRTRRSRSSRWQQLSAAKRKELEALPTYIACGCGCCFTEPAKVTCLYRSKGDDMQKIIEADKRAAANKTVCAVVGCALPVKYVYCD